MSERTTIWTHDHERAARDSWEAIRNYNDVKDPRQFIFRYGDAPCRFGYNDDGNLVAQPLNNDRLRFRLNEVARFKRKTDKGIVAYDGAPREVVSMALADPNPQLPITDQLVNFPIIAQNGKVVSKLGYSRAGRVFLRSMSVQVPEVPHIPTPADVQKAMRLIMYEALGDFPFADEASQLHAVALMIQPILRPLLGGTTPLYVINAPTPGSGKGLLKDVTAIPALGIDLPSLKQLTLGADDEEIRKQLTSTLLELPTHIVYDNVSVRINSASLSRALTSPTWQDRLLGINRIVNIKNRATWVVTGNNVQGTDEIIRRAVFINLDPQMENPGDRPTSDFRHPDLVDWVARSRRDLIWAALVLGRNWIAKGRPLAPGATNMGSFETWVRVMGGVLDAAGEGGFLLSNRRASRAAAGSEAGMLRSALAAWTDDRGAMWTTTSELPDGVYAAFGIDRYSHRASQALGIKLRQYEGRVVGGLVIQRVKNEFGDLVERGGAGVWSVVSVDGAGA